LVADGRVEFEVCDNGPGIAPSLRAKLGTAPVDSSQGGHGVGLYLAFAAATRLGGSVELVEGAPRGTRALLRLPVADAVADADADTDGEERGAARPLSESKENKA
jgi:two-component system sensor histidine kinase RegB